MFKKCKECAYGKGEHCSVMTEWIEDCFAYASKAEAKKRAEEIKKYTTGSEPAKNGRVYKRPAREKLKEGFQELYEKGMNDAEISETLRVSVQSTRNYRQYKGLPAHKKRRSARTVAASL